MTTIPKPANLTQGLTGKYDAWNRLVEVKDGTTVISTSEYDGLNRRIKHGIDSQAPDNPNGLDKWEHLFYNTSWQLLETRETTTESDQPESLQPKYQYIWSPRYIDACILRDKNTDTDGLCDDERAYFLGDANFNYATLVDTGGDILERCLYSPYGAPLFHNASWGAPSSSSGYAVAVGFTGQTLDAESRLTKYRSRDYQPVIGVFVQRDVQGLFSIRHLTSYVNGNPITNLDPTGKLVRRKLQASAPPNRSFNVQWTFSVDPGSPHDLLPVALIQKVELRALTISECKEGGASLSLPSADGNPEVYWELVGFAYPNEVGKSFPVVIPGTRANINRLKGKEGIPHSTDDFWKGGATPAAVVDTWIFYGCKRSDTCAGIVYGGDVAAYELTQELLEQFNSWESDVGFTLGQQERTRLKALCDVNPRPAGAPQGSGTFAATRKWDDSKASVVFTEDRLFRDPPASQLLILSWDCPPAGSTVSFFSGEELTKALAGWEPGGKWRPCGSGMLRGIGK